MMDIRAYAVSKLSRIGPQWLPFADVGTPEVPLSRLLRLSLFQITVGMALVLLVGTLNRVMIVELRVPASLVAGMLALPLLFAPFRALIGHRSDHHASAIGWRRTPFIWKGTLWQFGGFAIMPFALLVLSGYGEAASKPLWIGQGAAALAFLLVGAGLHMVQTAGLALAADLVKEEDQPKVVGLMYVMLLLGMAASALVFGALLETYSPGRLVQVIQGAAVATVILNGAALWKQEPRDRARGAAAGTAPRPPFREAWSGFAGAAGAIRLLVVIALGTAGFGMADVLLEPYGGQALGLSVADTTKLTALLALGTLIGFAVASRSLGRGGRPMALAALGALAGAPAFGAIILSAFAGSGALFAAGTMLAGLGAGLFGHATLTATLRAASKGQVGLAIGAWGAVQATAAGLAIAAGGLARDAILAGTGGGWDAAPYLPVFGFEIMLLVAAILIARPLLGRRGARVDGVAARHISTEAENGLARRAG